MADLSTIGDIHLSSPYLDSDLVFKNHAEFMAWALHEKETWSDLISGTSQNLRDTKVFLDHAEHTKKLADGIHQSFADEEPLGTSQVVSHELKMFNEGRLIPTQSSLGIHVIEIYKIDPILAAVTLSAASQKIGGDQFTWYNDHHFPGRFPEAINGWIELQLFKRGIESIRAKIKASSDELSKRTNSIEKLETKYSNLISAIESKFKTDKAYQFWKDKEESHRARAGAHQKTMRNFTLLSILLFSSLTGLIVYFQGQAKILETPLWVVISYTGVFFGVVWFGRIIVRLYLSQIALQEDAAERAIMAQTFVALVNEGAAKPDQLNIVLHALFRPAAKGADDDGAPQLPTEILIKRMTGEKSG